MIKLPDNLILKMWDAFIETFDENGVKYINDEITQHDLFYIFIKKLEGSMK